ncbi:MULTISPECIES: NUDIX hydrolase [Bradyrhizobium]|jgi:8-oxo-dGTP diphosphatase|uniref:NUDIX hydrolase n=1 Tax=Bradyrhizobium denitrificans TaxID=2734912 RepID=A0ABS5GJM9_9BRAD|nr:MULTISPECIES: NUDIX domain-containing protein [Bradyrhizobium]RTM06378.1 MAG: NUDIX domain-containing protein [Bradyrhizobiaceae bacterium]MBR1141479.1 NUDIX hydrolase [Bradyrhizobium denitrificans]MCL8489282.1 NUDIX hydrolase [Bradyrhizobium denitrificans]MDU0957099.1 NUDIX domain-containing protein [Bradyrhizobium sp.]MDU1497973.1 NUDIX domain-containing protein [Bradyrhizobium sp.]
MAGRHGQGDAAGDQGRSGAKAPGLDFPRPLTTVDIVIFTIRQEALQVLLVRRGSGPGEPFPGTFALPGGFVDIARDRDLEACARRKLAEKTGVVSPYLEQLGSWGSADRDPRGWSATHAYFALIPGSAVEAALAADVQWFPLEGTGVTPKLAFDHAEILQAAVQRLRNKVEYTSLPAYLMPKEFTLPELQRTYEIVLDRALEKSAFRTRMLSADLIEPIAKMRKGPNRPAQLYRLKKTAAPVYFARTFNAPE